MSNLIGDIESSVSLFLSIASGGDMGALTLSRFLRSRHEATMLSIGALNWHGYHPRATIGSKCFAQPFIET
jgi:hypothetical protein